jgi:cell division protein FtsB
MRWLALTLAALTVALPSPMWPGERGWLPVREYDRQLAAQRDVNAKLKARNDALDADVRDLKAGYEAIEERARADLGMIRNDEVFFQIETGGAGVKPPAQKPASTPAPRKKTEK